MQTLRLRKLLQPSQAERLLEAFVTRSGLLPDNAYQVRDPDALHSALRRVLTETTRTGQVWTCWAYATHMWLFTGEMSLALSRERGVPVLRIEIYGDDGVLKDSGTWMTDPEGSWQRCAD